MTSADEEVFKIIDNKENSVHTETHGIEANDLASLLHRFEEATTSSSDDLNIGIRTPKNKREMLMKAKSAGCSPAVTPPATPPPFRKIVMSKGQMTPSQQPVLMQGVKGLPIQLKFVLPPNSATTQGSIPTAKGVSKVSALPVTFLQTTGSSSTLTHSSLPNNLTLPRSLPANVKLNIVSGPQMRSNIVANSGNVRNNVTFQASSPRLAVPKPTNSIYIQKPSLATYKLLQNAAAASSSAPTIVGLKNGPTVSTPEVKKQKQPSATAPVSTMPLSSAPSPVAAKPKVSTKLSPAKELTADLNGSLLQSMLVSKTPMNSQVTSTQLSERLASTSGNMSANEVRSIGISNPSPGIRNPTKDQSSSSQQPQKPSSCGSKSSNDHDYCFLKMAPKDIVSKFKCNNNNKIKPNNIMCNEKVEQEDYLQVMNTSDLFDDVDEEEVTVEVPHIPELPVLSFDDINEFVLEEGEFSIDEQGNDALLASLSSPKVEEIKVEPAARKVISVDDYLSRKQRKYRQRAELSSSPIREDRREDVFDKIPSHYTALAIPIKPTKTSVFASATRDIGSTDHLQLQDSNEPVVEEGHYDKVPAHKRHFTNTVKDVVIKQEVIDTNETTDNNVVNQHDSRSRRSTSRHSNRSLSPHKARHRKRKRLESYRSNHSRSSRSPDLSSPSGSRERARSTTRRARTVSQGSCRSSSSCSTCSSRSYCSTCDGSSRSRSRSGSVSSRSSVSRSRSRSPGATRDYAMRSKRSRKRSFRSEHQNKHRRSRSRSNSIPNRHHGRSHRHRSRSRSSVDRQRIAQRRKEREEEKNRAMEERRVVYVGKIPDGYSKRQMHKRFEQFGDIKEIKLNFREHGDNYGFVTFSYACDAIAAKERGNVNGQLKFDLCFGGRRKFCNDQYADLDGNQEIEEEYAPMPAKMSGELDYAALLRQHSNQQRNKR